MNATYDFMDLIRKESEALEIELENLNIDIQAKTEEFAKVQEELLTQQLENHIEAERVAVYEMLIQKEEKSIKQSEESARKKLAHIDELVRKHNQSLSVRADIRNRNVSTLSRISIGEDVHFGNMRQFRAETKMKRAKLAMELSEANNQMRDKRKEYDELGASLRSVQCPEIDAFIKKELTEQCQKILKEGRRRLLDIKMENRTLWMKVNHDI